MNIFKGRLQVLYNVEWLFSYEEKLLCPKRAGGENVALGHNAGIKGQTQGARTSGEDSESGNLSHKRPDLNGAINSADPRKTNAKTLFLARIPCRFQ